MGTDWTMELSRQTGLRLNAVFDLPASLRGATEREQIQKIHALMLDVENLLDAACHAMQKQYPGLDEQAYHLVQELPRCPAVTAMTARHMPCLPDAVAVSIALRLWAGLLDAAKIVRDKVVIDHVGNTRPIAPSERGPWMRDTHARALGDPIYAAGVPVGPFAKRHKGEPVFYEGVPDDLQRLYFLDDIRSNLGSPGAVTP
jgi:hypothetical protein